MSATDILRVRLLGAFDVEGVPSSELGSRKARTLLKVLALAAGQPVATDTLVEVLWGDAPPADPAAQVAVLASRLRRVVGADRLVRRDNGYALAVDWVDVAELDVLLGEATARFAEGAVSRARAATGMALRLARGPLAADEDAAWFDIPREAAERTVARVRLLAAEAALAAGDPGEVVALAEAALDRDPYDEPALRLLMRAHVGAGRPASALAAYARTRRRLVEDLGVDPTRETEDLHTVILLRADEPPAAPTSVVAGTMTPVVGTTTRVVGRDRETARLDAALDGVAGGGSVLVVVEGEAGIGKTALVGSWAAGAAADGRATVLWGRCDELGRALALQPVLDAVAAGLRSQGRDVDSLGSTASVLRPLLGGPRPEVGGAATSMSTDHDAGRLVVYGALVDAVSALGAGRPVVFVVDDLHLADSSTVEWLHLAVRRGDRLLVVAPARPGAPRLPRADVIELGPLDMAAAAALVGEARAVELHERTGGNPLFLLELAAAPDDSLPASILDAVAHRVDDLGTAAPPLRTAAVLGPVVDLDVLAAVLRERPTTLLDGLETAVTARLLVEHGATFAFPHELVREAIVATTTASRRALVHREAARTLAARADHDPSLVAWHARQGGDLHLAASCLVAAADLAEARFELRDAERVLDEAVTLADGVAPRLARARVRMRQGRHVDATEDVERALAHGGGVEAYELAGWVAYYRRDYEAAKRYGDEGARRAGEGRLRASCLALAARVGHAMGELGDADRLLTTATAEAPGDVRALAQVWLGVLRVHQGRPSEGLDLVERALVDPAGLSHPFASLHARFGQVYALGLLGRVDDGLRAIEEFGREVERQAEQSTRFRAVLANMHGWLLRNVGAHEEADEHTGEAARFPDDGPGAEPYYVALLDLADGALVRGAVDEAGRLLEDGRGVHGWHGSMYWRQRSRHHLLEARLLVAQGHYDEAAELATVVARAADECGSTRHAVLARLTGARARLLAGDEPPSTVEDDIAALNRLARLEAWRVTAEVAAAGGGADRWWRLAEERVEMLAAGAGPYGESLRAAARATFAGLGR